MHLRALTVLLVAMNLGVALWWAMHTPPGPDPVPDAPADVPLLQLVSEAEAGALQAAALNAASASAGAGEEAPLVEAGEGPGAAAQSLRCYSLGPWTDAGAVEAARAALAPRALRMRERASAGGAVWRVVLRSLPSREAAQATAARLADAGFDDHFIIGPGPEAHAIALGIFSVEERARRHQAALREAGFAAVAEPLQGAGAGTWIDLAAVDFDPGAARAATGAAQSRPVDCARVQ